MNSKFYLSDYCSFIALFGPYQSPYYEILRDIQDYVQSKFSFEAYLASDISDYAVFNSKALNQFLNKFESNEDRQYLQFIHEFNNHVSGNNLEEYLDPLFFNFLHAINERESFLPINRAIISTQKSYFLVFQSALKIFVFPKKTSVGINFEIKFFVDNLEKMENFNSKKLDIIANTVFLLETDSASNSNKIKHQREFFDFNMLDQSELLIGELTKLFNLFGQINFPILFSNWNTEKKRVFDEIDTILIDFQVNQK